MSRTRCLARRGVSGCSETNALEPNSSPGGDATATSGIKGLAGRFGWSVGFHFRVRARWLPQFPDDANVTLSAFFLAPTSLLPAVSPSLMLTIEFVTLYFSMCTLM